MEARLGHSGTAVGGKVLTYLDSAGKAAGDPSLSATTQALVRIRASRVNGRGLCTDTHTRGAAHAGGTRQRLHLAAAWREATAFPDAERAAPGVAEQATRIADAAGGVTDEAWAAAAEHYGTEQHAAPVSLPAAVNADNRIDVRSLTPAGSYRPGRFC